MSKIPNDDEAIFIAAASPEVDMDRISDLSYRPAVQPPPLIRAVRQFLNSLGPEGLRAYREIGGFGYCPVCDESNGHAPTCSYLLLILENNRSLEQWVKGATLLGLSPDLSALEGAVPHEQDRRAEAAPEVGTGNRVAGGSGVQAVDASPDQGDDERDV